MEIDVTVREYKEYDLMTICCTGNGILYLNRDEALELLEKINANLGKMRVNIGQTKEK